MNYTYDTFSIPFGDFSIALDEHGAIAATAFGGVSRLERELQCANLRLDSLAAGPARDQVLEYFVGERRDFDLPLAPMGTSFQLKVWEALQAIPYGETRSYREIAAEIGNERACRAVGRANGSNPICLIIPCHRVIGADGSLTGFGSGEDLKRHLLDHEQAHADKSAAKGELLFA